MLRPKRAGLEFDHHIAAQDQVIKQKVDVEVLAAHLQAVLAADKGKTAQEIYRRTWGVGFAKDIVVVTESDVQEYGTNPYMIIKNALEEGKELYHAAE